LKREHNIRRRTKTDGKRWQKTKKEKKKIAEKEN
jgi:hypothetical protein